MTVSNVAPTYTPVISNVPISPDSLDATAIVSYCTSRLNSLDDLIKSRFADQQHRNDAIKQASALVAQLNTFAGGVTKGAGDTDGGEHDYGKGHVAMGAGLANIYKTSTDPQVRAKCLEFYQLTTGKPMPLNKDGSPQDIALNPNAPEAQILDRNKIEGLDNNAWQAKIGDVKSMQDNFTKDNELGMISLQSIVSQRQLGVQLTTQLMSAMNDTSKQILGNVK